MALRWGKGTVEGKAGSEAAHLAAHPRRLIMASRVFRSSAGVASAPSDICCRFDTMLEIHPANADTRVYTDSCPG